MRMRNLAHIGVGNFHRSHQAEYFHQLNELSSGQEQWNIVGISLLARDQALLSILAKQDYQYHLVKRAPDGAESVTRIEAIQDIIFAHKDYARTIDFLASQTTEIISFTITEGAYLVDQKSTQLDWQHPDLIHDVQHLEQPRTIFGYLYNALSKRRQLHGCGVTLMSCDNVRHNGLVLNRALHEFVSKVDTDLADWILAEVSFPSTMVDRITPAASVLDQQHLKRKYGIEDAAPVVSEMFRQWVVEDNFRYSRPDLDKVGVIFTPDVSPFEDLKIKLLNGGHSSLAYLASLAGYEFVHEAIADEALRNFVKSYMQLDARPCLKSTPGIDVDEYIDTLLERFANASIADKVERLCADGISKLCNFLMPVTKASLKSGRSLERLAMVYAAYYLYLKRAVQTNDPGNYPIYEPQSDNQTLQNYSQNLSLLLQRLGVADKQSVLLDQVADCIQNIEQSSVTEVLKNEVVTHV